MPALESSVYALFEGDNAITPESAEKLLDRFMGNYQLSEQKLYRRFTLIVVIWLAEIILSKGGISEVSVLGAQIKDLTVILVCLPLLAAALLYGVAASFSAMVLYLFATRALINRRWPSLTEGHLDDLLLPSTFFSLEVFVGRHLTGVWDSIDASFKYVGLAALLLAPLAFVVHIHYVFAGNTNVSPWLVGSVMLVSAGLIVKGLLLIFHLVDEFGGN